MNIDKRAEFTASQALTAGTTALTNHYNAGGDFDLGPGQPLYWNLVLLAEALAGTTPTYRFDLQTDDNDSFSSPEVIGSITVVQGAPAGSKYTLGFPMTNQKYIRVVAVLADGGATATVTVASWLSDKQTSQQRAYADNIPG